MNIDYLIQLLQNRLNGLALAKDQAFQAGDIERIVAVDAEILDVQNTLSKLKLVSTIEQTAAATPYTEAEVVKNGIEASFNNMASGVTSGVSGYDISSYATDPEHEAKIQQILNVMPPLTTAEEIDVYIKASAPDSPVTGTMVFDACNKYGVSVSLALAIMQQDSQFGTAGVAVRTMNPGNVGNTGSAEHAFASWQEGVEAVAQWLADHRIGA